jgi:hypothetical protein
MGIPQQFHEPGLDMNFRIRVSPRRPALEVCPPLADRILNRQTIENGVERSD